MRAAATSPTWSRARCATAGPDGVVDHAEVVDRADQRAGHTVRDRCAVEVEALLRAGGRDHDMMPLAISNRLGRGDLVRAVGIEVAAQLAVGADVQWRVR